MDKSRFAVRRGLRHGGVVASTRIISPADAFALFAPLADAPDERLWAAYLDIEGALLRLWQGPPGSACAVVLPVADLLRVAAECGAQALIVAHNHPGRDPVPSLQDVRTTRRLADGAAALGIALLDHVVVGAEACASFRLLGLL